MRRFARLFQELDETTKTTDRVESLVRYFREVEPADAAWATWFLCGQRPRRVIRVSQLQEWCAELAGIPEWLFEESREFVGDLAETIALLLPGVGSQADDSLAGWIEQKLLALPLMNDAARRIAIQQAWQALNQTERLVFNKLLTGGFRIGVSQKLVIRALAEVSGIAGDVIAHRLMGQWKPTADFFESLMNPDTTDTQISRPYPFCLAHGLSDETAEELLTDSVDSAQALVAEQTPNAHDIPASKRFDEHWIIEWKWDGIRAQLIVREGQVFIWSRGEELLTERFPEIEQAARQLPNGTVLDGEIVGWKNGRLLPFSDLQKRIQRKVVGPSIRTAVPVRFIAFDLLEWQKADLRSALLNERRTRLEGMGLEPAEASGATITLAPRLSASTWSDCVQLRTQSREHLVEGLMLKQANSQYEVGRVAGTWWKWKNEPFHCDAVMLYAQRGHGRRAGKFTDFTFAIWDNGQLVPFAKAYSGLTNAEIEEVDRFVRDNTIERFGPVSSVKAELVFELAFENIQLSSRHKSGLAVRFPRIARWRKDKTIEQADSLEHLRMLIRQRTSVETSEAENTGEDPATMSVPQAEPALSGRRRKGKKKPQSDQPLGGLFAGMDEE
jgi:DNA ligase-1